MYVQPAERLSALHEDVGELWRVLARLRWQLGFERLALFGLRGLIASGVVLVGLSGAAWLTGTDLNAGAAGLPLFVALAAALVRWPSKRETAMVADRRLALDERLATATEVMQRQRRRQGGRFDWLQVRDAVDRARSAPRRRLELGQHLRGEALLAVAVVGVAFASLLLPRLPRPQFLASNQVESVLDAVGADAAERTVPPDPQNLGLTSEHSDQPPQPDADLAARVQQVQAEQVALDRLAQALASISAGQSAAEAIQQGDFGTARDLLQGLAEEADQLSDAAKKQLANALQQAAAATGETDRQLADKERQSAQTLNRGSYNEQRQAVRGLADQVERSGARSMPANQLARAVGQLQQQATSAQPARQGADAAQGPAADGPPQATPGIGAGSDTNILGDGSKPSRLDSAGQNVQVPTKLASGPGVRPPDGAEDQLALNPAITGRSVSEAPLAQKTGKVVPEQNLVRGEQRPIVRGYFR